MNQLVEQKGMPLIVSWLVCDDQALQFVDEQMGKKIASDDSLVVNRQEVG